MNPAADQPETIGQERQREFAALAASRQAVLAEFAKLAFANILDYVRIDQDGLAEVDLRRVDRDTGAAIDEVIVDYSDPRNGDPPQVKRVRFKLADKRAALVDLGRHLGLFSERRPADELDMSDAELRQRISVGLAGLAAVGIDVRSLLPPEPQRGGTAAAKGAGEASSV